MTGRTVEYAYSPLDHLLKVTDGGRELAVYEYHPDGTIKSLTHGHGNRTKKGQLGGETLYHYDPLNQLVKVEYPGRTEELLRQGLQPDPACVVDGLEERYEYDARNRLTAYTKGGVTTPFQYDGAGNLYGLWLLH